MHRVVPNIFNLHARTILVIYIECFVACKIVNYRHAHNVRIHKKKGCCNVCNEVQKNSALLMCVYANEIHMTYTSKG